MNPQEGSSQKSERLPSAANYLIRTIIDVALALHLAAAVAYWWFSPKGFPFDSSRFWLNSVLPFVLIVVACVGLVGMHRHRWPVAAVAVLCFASVWFAGGISGRILFPASLRIVWLLPVLVSAGGYACFWWLTSSGVRSYRTWLLSGMLSALVGLFVVWTQIPLPAATKPVNAETPKVADARKPMIVASALRVGAPYEFNPAAAQLTLEIGKIQIQCEPILDFERISQDGFWSLFARRASVHRSPVELAHSGEGDTFRYSDGSVVEIAAPTVDNSLEVTAFSPVPSDTYSHLNTYCLFEIYGHRRLSLSFSPIPGDQIDVLPADYPTGRPARMAYVDESSLFHIVEAASGEKGPFHPLAIGKLGREEPLTITIHDEGQPVASIALEDWSRQVSTNLSPTAGWGLPVNSIEFRRLGDAPSSPVAIWVSLAATSVGRGWDAVGHRAGIYRNRLEFRLAAPPK